MATWNELDLGGVDAYAAAVKAGYTGTRQEWMTAMQNAEANGLKSEGFATGKQNGVAVESGTYFHDNAEYFKDQAAGSATAAAASAADALEHTQSVIHTWLETNIDPDSGYALDRTLTEPLEAAPADMVGALKSALDSVTEETVNIWDETWRIGVLAADGTMNLNPNPSSIGSYLIDCDPSTTYYAKTPTGNSIRIAQYKSDESFIGFIGYKQNETFITASNAAYLMFCSAGQAVSEYGHNISINRLVGDYQKYYPHKTAIDAIARGLQDKIDIINPSIQTIGNGKYKLILNSIPNS